jgi:uncharacterized protein YegP (UPF0339 family)
MTFVLYQDVRGEYRWTLWSGSDRIANSGEGYKTHAYTLSMIHKIMANARDAKIEDRTKVLSR